MISSELARFAILAYIFTFGAIFGSFGNVLVYRLPADKKITGRSNCPKCKKTLGFLDLVPILSYVFLRGKCRYCSTKISPQYPLVEFLSGILFLFAYFVASPDILAFILLAFCFWLLLLIAVVDAKIQGIPDAFNIPFVALALGYSFVAGTFDWVAFAAGIGFIGGQWLLSKGTWVGSGDIILIAGISALLGRWPAVVFCLFGAYILGAVIASGLLFSGKKTRKDALAFGPFLVLSTFITIAWGDMILWTVYGV